MCSGAALNHSHISPCHWIPGRGFQYHPLHSPSLESCREQRGHPLASSSPKERSSETLAVSHRTCLLETQYLGGGWLQLDTRCHQSCSVTPFLRGTRKRKFNERVMGWDKGRERSLSNNHNMKNRFVWKNVNYRSNQSRIMRKQKINLQTSQPTSPFFLGSTSLTNSLHSVPTVAQGDMEGGCSLFSTHLCHCFLLTRWTPHTLPLQGNFFSGTWSTPCPSFCTVCRAVSYIVIPPSGCCCAAALSSSWMCYQRQHHLHW